MPLAILEIKMPKSCRTCDLVYFMGGDLMCISTHSTVGDFSKNRAPFCPLKTKEEMALLYIGSGERKVLMRDPFEGYL